MRILFVLICWYHETLFVISRFSGPVLVLHDVAEAGRVRQGVREEAVEGAVR